MIQWVSHLEKKGLEKKEGKKRCRVKICNNVRFETQIQAPRKKIEQKKEFYFV
jgi:hypothetical protein